MSVHCPNCDKEAEISMQAFGRQWFFLCDECLHGQKEEAEYLTSDLVKKIWPDKAKGNFVHIDFLNHMAEKYRQLTLAYETLATENLTMQETLNAFEDVRVAVLRACRSGPRG